MCDFTSMLLLFLQVHAVRIKAGKVTYSNRFVRTKRLRAEEEVGKPLALK